MCVSLVILDNGIEVDNVTNLCKMNNHREKYVKGGVLLPKTGNPLAVLK